MSEIDLNEGDYVEKSLILPEDILKYVSDVDIFNHYAEEDYTIGPICSPLRADDTVPSFSIFYGDRSGKMMWKDWAKNVSGDWIGFVVRYYHYLNFNDVLIQVCRDLGIIHNFPGYDSKTPVGVKSYSREEAESTRKKLEERTAIKTTIDILPRKALSATDKKFWNQYHIPDLEQWLNFYRIYSINKVFYNGSLYGMEIPEQNPAYGYLEMKDGKPSYKIYRPLHPDKSRKWFNNGDASVWEGWEQLPDTGDLLIITKSLKDVVCIRSTTRIPCVSLKAESVLPKPHVFKQLQKRFTNVVIFYDNDFDKSENYGQKFANKLSETFKVPNIMVPSKYITKDYTDLIAKLGREKTVKIFLTELVTQVNIKWNIKKECVK